MTLLIILLGATICCAILRAVFTSTDEALNAEVAEALLEQKMEPWMREACEAAYQRELDNRETMEAEYQNSLPRRTKPW